MPHLNAPRLTLAEYKRNVFAAEPEAGITLEQVTANTFWDHVANQLRPRDLVHVIPEDGSFFAELLVLKADNHRAIVKLLRHHVLTEEVVKIEEEGEDTTNERYDIVFRGVKYKHSVVRKTDREVIKEGFATRGEAASWLKSYEMGLIDE